MPSAFVLLVVGGCAETSPDIAPRFTAEAEGFSCIVPADWALTRDRGSVVLTAAEDRRHTVVIRSVPLSPAQDATKIVADTKVVLSGLPGVELEQPREVAGGIPATEFRLTFIPPMFSERFRRRHVVLRAKRRVFHVIETAPTTSLRTDDVISEFVATLREEG